MSSAEERILQDRRTKLDALRERGVDPYPSHVTRTHTTAQVREQFEALEKSGESVTITGRIRAMRKMGGAAFIVIEDGAGKLQAFVQKDALGRDFEVVALLDLGDFVGATGVAFKTKTGEQSVRAAKIAVLTKSLRPLPDQFHGLKDHELRARKRELDLLANAEVRKLFEQRALVMRYLRDFLDARGFLEVETPVLQPLAGGTLATPFTTHHDALDIDLFLRIAPELYLKRLVVGGFERVYELGKIYRNEGMSPQHLQEITELEFYQAYANYETLMELTEEMLTEVLKKTFGTLKFQYGEHELDFSSPWPRVDYFAAVKDACGIDLMSVTDAEALRKEIAARKLDVHLEPKMGYGTMVDNLYKATVRPRLIQPTFLVGHPIAVSPLAKRDPDKPGRVQRFQVAVAGFELCNAYSELNDPVDQLARFEEQASMREAGDAEAHVKDEEFVESLEYGMPPTAGWGMGIDRLMALVTNQANVRDVVLFPTLRPKQD